MAKKIFVWVIILVVGVGLVGSSLFLGISGGGNSHLSSSNEEVRLSAPPEEVFDLCGAKPSIFEFWDIDPEEAQSTEPPTEVLEKYNSSLQSWLDCVRPFIVE